MDNFHDILRFGGRTVRSDGRTQSASSNEAKGIVRTYDDGYALTREAIRSSSSQDVDTREVSGMMAIEVNRDELMPPRWRP